MDFVMPYVGASREPPDIMALIEAPLHQKTGSPQFRESFGMPALKNSFYP